MFKNVIMLLKKNRINIDKCFSPAFTSNKHTNQTKTRVDPRTIASLTAPNRLIIQLLFTRNVTAVPHTHSHTYRMRIHTHTHTAVGKNLVTFYSENIFTKNLGF